MDDELHQEAIYLSDYVLSLISSKPLITTFFDANCLLTEIIAGKHIEYAESING